jgi:hypothetical protein
MLHARPDFDVALGEYEHEHEHVDEHEDDHVYVYVYADNAQDNDRRNPLVAQRPPRSASSRSRIAFRDNTLLNT